MNRCMRHHHNDTTGTDHRCQLADGHTGPHADPELRTSTRSPRGVHSMQWDDDGTSVPHTEHAHTAPRLVDTDGVGVTFTCRPPSARMRDEQHIDAELFALFLQMVRPGAGQGVIEGPPYHCDINAMRALFPYPHWQWPKPPYDRLPHPAAAAELPVILTRGAVDD